MKKLNYIFTLLAAGATFSLTSCLDETFPQSRTATADQVQSSPAALQGAINGIPSAMSRGYYVYGDQTHETDMAYPAYMIAQTEMLSDMFPAGSNSGYDWYRSYNVGSQGANVGESSYYSYLPWFTFYKFIKNCNDVINVVDPENDKNPENLAIAGAAYATRAFNYYMLAVLFEPVANDLVDQVQLAKVLGTNPPQTALTVCKVTEKTSGDDAKSNPRLTHKELTEFILSDLKVAEKCFKSEGVSQTDRTLPNLAATFAIKAKVYAWDENYEMAKIYADSAIIESGRPMTKNDWLDKNKAFTTACDGWIWNLKYSAEEMGNLCNFIGWVSGEGDWGYSSLTCPAINKILYDKIGDTDFRKGVWLDPDRTKTLEWYDKSYEKLTSRDKAFIDDAPDYLSLKFRCKEGNWEDYTVGAAVDVPVLRVEEMYLLRALAMGELDVTEGVNKLNEFMNEFRDPEYNCKLTNKEAFEQEVLTQMRIEFWGEGNAFPYAKRIGMDVLNNYEGTNLPSDLFKVNYKGGKPNWTLVIPLFETQSNNVLKTQNNPDPSNVTSYPTKIGEWAVKK